MHSFNSCLMHGVFSTKERRPWLTPAIRERLWPCLGGIARENDMKALAIGGVSGAEDTVHYIEMQEQYHRKKSFREELEVFLKKHGCDHKAETLD